ncbi:hypothetical protein [Chondromyces apiculatus]|uniref:DUF4365 domain-containing protein n=1 Tax=Chondromyces apiculatus DSM 436 TaxID=1192034 RepID=A0A017T922_9BACT|nr:hypothetical protein [Chondromyces apiculatus]EYF05739.1 Hypothetical protein CAP_3029 [Chondromyces apiculatus DSM 436]
MSTPKITDRSPLTFGSRGKRRSVSQKAGKKGQLLFEQWALEQRLVANPCPEDFGVDYFCQVLSASENSTEEVRGEVLAVQVRSVKGGARPRIKLDKVDAENALRLESPYLLVGVNTETNQVVYRFLDAAFAKRLATFINAPEAELTLRLDANGFQSVGFRTAIAENCRPGVQHRLRILCAQLCVQQDITGARLRVSQSADSGFARVEVPWISSIFQVQADHEDAFRKLVFEQGKFPDPGTKGVDLQPSLFRFLDVAGTDQMLVRGTFEDALDGFVELGGTRKSLSFRVRTAGNEIAFVSECGLVCTISDRVQDDSGTFVHKMGFSLSREFGKNLDDFAEYDAAIRLLRPGAKLGFSEDDTRTHDVAAWGPSLEHLGVAYEQMVAGIPYVGLPLREVHLADLKNEEFAAAVTLLAALAKGATLPQLMQGFLIGPAASDPNFQERLEPAIFDVPLVMNVNNHGVVVWIQGEALVYVNDQRVVCGFTPTKQTGHRIQIRGEKFKKVSNSPEVWVHKYWPGIPLLEKLAELSTWTGGVEHELDGVMTLIDLTPSDEETKTSDG